MACVCLRLYSGLAALTTSCKRLFWDTGEPVNSTRHSEELFKPPRCQKAPLASFDALILTSREQLLEGAFAGLGFSLLNHTRALLEFACCCPVNQKLLPLSDNNQPNNSRKMSPKTKEARQREENSGFGGSSGMGPSHSAPPAFLTGPSPLPGDTRPPRVRPPPPGPLLPATPRCSALTNTPEDEDGMTKDEDEEEGERLRAGAGLSGVPPPPMLLLLFRLF